MSEPLYREINSRLTSGDTFKIYYKKCYTTDFHVYRNDSNINNIYRLFPSDVKLPERVYFVLVDKKSKNGDQTTNPFRFIRKYYLAKASSSTSGSDTTKRQRIEAQNSEDSNSVTEMPVFIESLELCVNSNPISQVHFYPFNVLTF